MLNKVIKRDGREVAFSQERIEEAIIKAFKATGFAEETLPLRLLSNIAAKIASKPQEVATVEQIQDWVVGYLMKSPYPKVAEEYVQYRHDRDKARKAKARKVLLSIVNAETNDITRENANMNADSPAGMMMKFASELTKEFTDDNLLSKEARKAVDDNILHIHDKDYYPTKSLTCLQHPLDKLLTDGFRAGHGESRPAKRIETAAILACISLETVQNEMHTLNCAA